MINKLKNSVLDFLFKNQTIPSFPNFKKISLSDRASLEAMVGHRYPYSTFNFTNLWAWDIHHTRMISSLNGNLVLLFTEYESNKPFLFFHGKNRPVHTAKGLLSFAQSHDISTSLRFITEETSELLKSSDFLIEEDVDNSDYIFSTEKISESKGQMYKSKRLLAKTFISKNPDAILEIRDLSNEQLKEDVYSVLKRWEQNKSALNKSFDLKNEEIALSRLFKEPNEHRLIFTSITVKGEMVGFSIDEILPGKYAMAHFIKADVTHKGIYEYLNEMTARYLLVNGVDYWNWQQDLGIRGLRKVKQSYRPVHMLRKFTVTLK